MFALANLADFGIALVGAVSAIVTVVISTRSQNKKLDKVEASVATSNGKTSGEYIEEMYHNFTRLEIGQAAMVRKLAEHTVQDAEMFATIAARLDHMEQTK